MGDVLIAYGPDGFDCAENEESLPEWVPKPQGLTWDGLRPPYATVVVDPLVGGRAGKYGSLCTGVGGLDLAVEAAFDVEMAWYAETDGDACKVLEHHFPGVPNLGDIKTIDWSDVEPVDLVSAGYPCQPFSVAGKRKGSDDPRHLWPYIARAVGVLGPRFVVLENVAGHLQLGFDAVLGDLASLGFDAEWTTLRASDVGACHRRERLFVIAYANSDPRGHQPVGLAGSGGATAASDLDAAAFAQPNSDGRTSEQWIHGTIVDGSGDALAPHTDGSPGDARERTSGTHGEPSTVQRRRRPDRGPVEFPWGRYQPAIARHERAFGRPAPWPVIEGTRSLSGDFTAWMMGLPQGWLDVGISNTAKKRLSGNAVMPAQAVAALRLLGAAC